MSLKIHNSRTIAAVVRRLCATKFLPCDPYRLLQNGPDTIDELLDRHLVKYDKKDLDDDENEILTRQRLTSTRREALSLYRDIIRASRFFMWADSRGRLWRDVLRENARKEFEEARFEKDPEVITRLLIGGRDAVQAAIDKLVEKQKQEIERGRNDADSIGDDFGISARFEFRVLIMYGNWSLSFHNLPFSIMELSWHGLTMRTPARYW